MIPQTELKIYKDKETICSLKKNWNNIENKNGIFNNYYSLCKHKNLKWWKELKIIEENEVKRG